QRIAIGNGLDDLLHAGAADHKHFTFTASLLDGFDGADGDVVVLGSHGLDIREAGQEVLHHAETIIAVPVGEFIVQNGDVRTFNASHEGVETLLVDRDRQAAQDDNVAAIGQTALDVFGSIGAETRIVAGDVEVFHAIDRELAVDNGDELAGI